MKDIMALIQYRLKEADESLKEAEVILREGMSMRPTQTVQKLFFSCILTELSYHKDELHRMMVERS